MLGAYGWALSLDEVKWIADWNAVRGITDFLLHAVFSSVRGNRAYESEPDVGWHNAWWPHLPVMLCYLARTTLLNRALAETPGVAVAVADDTAPADEVAWLYEHQVPFAYVPARRGGSRFDRPVASDGRRGLGALRAVLLPPAAAGHPLAERLGAGGLRVTDDPTTLGDLAPEGIAVRHGPRSELRVRPGTLAGTPGRPGHERG